MMVWVFVLEMSQMMQDEDGETGCGQIDLTGLGKEFEFYSKCNSHQRDWGGGRELETGREYCL